MIIHSKKMHRLFSRYYIHSIGYQKLLTSVLKLPTSKNSSNCFMVSLQYRKYYKTLLNKVKKAKQMESYNIFMIRRFGQTQLVRNWTSGEGNGNPLQYSCLENPRDGGAWWDAIYGVTQSWTRLKRLSNNSNRC